MLEKTGTCPNCGYLRSNCMCGRKRNTSGDFVAYQNYQKYPNDQNYAMTADLIVILMNLKEK